MKKNFLVVLYVFASTCISAQLTFQGAIAMGGNGSELSKAIFVDASGNIYTTGYFGGTSDFDPGPGIFNLTSSSTYDIFVSKVDASGNFIWAKRFGGTGSAYAYGIAADAAENVYVTGCFWGMTDFDPDAGTYNLTAYGYSDIFICKLSVSGNLIWAKQMNGGNIDCAFSIALDANAHVFTTGNFGSTTDFDPGPGVYNLTALGPGAIFISEIDSAGNFVMAKQMDGVAGGGNGNSITLDANGNIYTTGQFFSTVDFDPGPGNYPLVSFGNYDAFVSKLDASGNFIWAKQLGSANDDYGNSITVDANGNVFTTGVFKDTADFDPGSGTYNLISLYSSYDIFISKLNASGNFLWAKQIGGTFDDSGNSITVYNNNVYTTGSFANTADFDPGPATYYLTTAFGGTEIFILQLNTLGNFIFAGQMGDPNGGEGYAITTDAAGNVISTGGFSGTSDFDPGPGIYTLIGAGIYISKLSNVPTVALSHDHLPNLSSLFPNPVMNELMVKSQGSETIDIYNTFGEKVFSQQTTIDIQQTVVDVSSLRPGIYFVTLINQNGNKAVRKFVKM